MLGVAAAVAVDVFLMGAPLAIWVLVLVGLGKLVAALVGGRDRGPALALLGGAVLIALGLAGNVALAERRARRLVTAIEAYRSANGQYPRSLPELVPKYLSEIPRVALRLASPEFHYFRPPDEAPVLFWTALAPFGKGSHNFRTGQTRALWD